MALRPAGGSGIGLAITARAIRLHRGTVVAENTGGVEGSGLVVTIDLPTSARPPSGSS